MKTTPKTTKIRNTAGKAAAKLLLSMLVLALLLFATSCGTYQTDGTEKGDASDTNTVTVVVSNDSDTLEYTVDISELEEGAKAIDLLVYLKENEDLELDYTNSTYGAYVTRVGHISEKAADGIYVGFWTSCEKDFDVSQYATEVEYDGRTLASSGVGISEMSFEGGDVIYVGELCFK